MPTLPPVVARYALPAVVIWVADALVSVVSPVTLRVPVALIFAAKILPEKNAFPCTERSCEGEVVPIPTNPLREFKSRLPPKALP